MRTDMTPSKLPVSSIAQNMDAEMSLTTVEQRSTVYTSTKNATLPRTQGVSLRARKLTHAQLRNP